MVDHLQRGPAGRGAQRRQLSWRRSTAGCLSLHSASRHCFTATRIAVALQLSNGSPAVGGGGQSMLSAPERVELELWLCPGADQPVAVGLHILDPTDGTPTRSFGLRPASCSGAFSSPASSSSGRHEALNTALQEAVEVQSSSSACPAATAVEQEAAADTQLDSPTAGDVSRASESLQQAGAVGGSSNSCHAAHTTPPSMGEPAKTPALDPVLQPTQQKPPQSAALAVEAAIQEAAAAAAARSTKPEVPSNDGGSAQAALASVMGLLLRLREPSESEASAQAELLPLAQQQRQQQEQVGSRARAQHFQRESPAACASSTACISVCCGRHLLVWLNSPCPCSRLQAHLEDCLARPCPVPAPPPARQTAAPPAALAAGHCCLAACRSCLPWSSRWCSCSRACR